MLVYADSPFLDPEIIKDMLDVHLRYLAEFTYSENLPRGYSCEIIAHALVKSVPESDSTMLPLSEVVRSNINQFDVELYYRDPDIREKTPLIPFGRPSRAACNGKHSCRHGYKTPVL